jgi:hypothetical protein
MSKIPFYTPSFSATGTMLAVGSRAQFRLLLKLLTGCRA